jgi:hypothetical protein
MSEREPIEPIVRLSARRSAVATLIASTAMTVFGGATDNLQEFAWMEGADTVETVVDHEIDYRLALEDDNDSSLPVPRCQIDETIVIETSKTPEEPKHIFLPGLLPIPWLKFRKEEDEDIIDGAAPAVEPVGDTIGDDVCVLVETPTDIPLEDQDDIVPPVDVGPEIDDEPSRPDDIIIDRVPPLEDDMQDDETDRLNITAHGGIGSGNKSRRRHEKNAKKDQRLYEKKRIKESIKYEKQRAKDQKMFDASINRDRQTMNKNFENSRRSMGYNSNKNRSSRNSSGIASKIGKFAGVPLALLALGYGYKEAGLDAETCFLDIDKTSGSFNPGLSPHWDCEFSRPDPRPQIPSGSSSSQIPSGENPCEDLPIYWDKSETSVDTDGEILNVQSGTNTEIPYYKAIDRIARARNNGATIVAG